MKTYIVIFKEGWQEVKADAISVALLTLMAKRGRLDDLVAIIEKGSGVGKLEVVRQA